MSTDTDQILQSENAFGKFHVHSNYITARGPSVCIQPCSQGKSSPIGLCATLLSEWIYFPYKFSTFHKCHIAPFSSAAGWPRFAERILKYRPKSKINFIARDLAEIIENALNEIYLILWPWCKRGHSRSELDLEGKGGPYDDQTICLRTLQLILILHPLTPCWTSPPFPAGAPNFPKLHFSVHCSHHWT